MLLPSYLNTDNIIRSTPEAEYHPLRPCIDADTRVLFMGSFPPPMKRWAKDFFFFYPNFINDHWRIMGLIFFGDKDHLVDAAHKTYRYDRILSLVREKHIGYFDTATAVKRLKDNASDKFLEVVVKTDIPALIRRAPALRAIAVTGEKAARTLCDTFAIPTIPKTGHFIPLPVNNLYCESQTLTDERQTNPNIKQTNSNLNPIDPNVGQISLWRLPSSSRAYPMRLEDKASFYRHMFESLHIIP